VKRGLALSIFLFGFLAGFLFAMSEEAQATTGDIVVTSEPDCRIDVSLTGLERYFLEVTNLEYRCNPEVSNPDFYLDNLELDLKISLR